MCTVQTITLSSTVHNKLYGSMLVLLNFRLVDEFHSQLGGHEAASDGIITDLDYSSEMYVNKYTIKEHQLLLQK